MTLIIGKDAETGEEVTLGYKERTTGTAIIGQTGFGKSTLLTHIILENVRQGTCCFVFDPHGDLCRTVINTTPQRFKDNLVLIDIDPSIPFHLNPFYCSNTTDLLHLANNADNFVTLFKKILGNDTRLIRTDRVLQNVATVLIQNQGHTLLDVPKLLQERPFRDTLLRNVTNPAVIRFWKEDYERLYTDSRSRADMIDPVLNRMGALIEQDFLYRIFSQSTPTLKFAELFNTRKVYLINLSALSESNIELLGTILLFELATSIYTRAATIKRPRVELIIDEFGKFALSDITANLLLQGRKYELATITAIQVLASLNDDKNKSAFFQAGSIISFQAVGDDALEIAKNLDCTPPEVPERKRAIPQVVFDLLVSGRHSHSNPRVRELVKAFLSPVARGEMVEIVKNEQPDVSVQYEERFTGYTMTNEQGEYTGIKRPTYAAYPRIIPSHSKTKLFMQEAKQKLNELLYDVVTDAVKPGSWEFEYYLWPIVTLITDYNQFHKTYLAPFHRGWYFDLVYRKKPWPTEDIIMDKNDLLTQRFYPQYGQYQDNGDGTVTIPPQEFKAMIESHYKLDYDLQNALHYTEGLTELCELLTLEENRDSLQVGTTFADRPQQMTYQDMARKIANDLVTLPKFTMLCQFTTNQGIKQCTVKLKDPEPWRQEITEEEIRESGRSRFGKLWQTLHHPPTSKDTTDKSLQEPPERKTWEEE